MYAGANNLIVGGVNETVSLSGRFAEFSTDLIPEVILWLAPTGRVLSVNWSACVLFGYEPDEMLRCHMWDLAEGQDDQGFAVLWEAVRSGRTASLGGSFRTRQGGRLMLGLSLSFVAFGEEQYICAIGHGVGKAERQRLRHGRLLQSIAEGLARATGERFFAQIARDLCRALEAAATMIGRLDADGARLSSLAAYADGAYQLPRTCAAAEPPFGTTSEIWTSQTGMAGPFAEDHPLRVQGYHSFAGIRLACPRHAPLGIIVVLFRQPVEDPAAVLHVLRMFSVRTATELERSESEKTLETALLSTIDAIATALEKRDLYTAGHQRRVAALATAIAERCAMDGHQLQGLRLGALVHDIGKIGIPAEFLSKPSRLTAAEFEIIKTHSAAGYDIIRDVPLPWPVREMVLQHHERLDGSGYPQGLRGDEIIPEARILAVADVVEAIASHRPYRPALGIEAALAELRRGRGGLFEPTAVDATLDLFAEGFHWPDAL